LIGFAEANIGVVPESLAASQASAWLDLLVTHWIEPRMQSQPLFVYDYPQSQAALARLRQHPLPVAERFELYISGIEIANGFQELGDASQQRARFEADNRMRVVSGQQAVPMDEKLLAALDAGLPDSSGVAVGFDRLVMLAAEASEIRSAMPFPLDAI
jgi:lysyl-tRNA synthetase class 2